MLTCKIYAASSLKASHFDLVIWFSSSDIFGGRWNGGQRPERVDAVVEGQLRLCSPLPGEALYLLLKVRWSYFFRSESTQAVRSHSCFWLLALPRTSCVTLTKVLKGWEFSFLICNIKILVVSVSRVCCGAWMWGSEMSVVLKKMSALVVTVVKENLAPERNETRLKEMEKVTIFNMGWRNNFLLSSSLPPPPFYSFLY